MTKKVPKRPPSPSKTEVLYEKKKSIFTQKDHPAPQKLMLCMKKSVIFYSKRPSSPAKTEVLHENIVFFYSKRPPSLAKNWNFALKNHKNMTKNVPKRAPSSAKTEVLHKKNVFFYSKRPPSPAKSWSFAWKNAKNLTTKLKNHTKKPEVLHAKLKTVLLIGILKKKNLTPNFTKFENP